MRHRVLAAALAVSFAALPLPALAGPGHDHSADAHARGQDVPPGRFFGGLLDGKSAYYREYFPAPLISPESTIERQFRLDYTHAEDAATQADQVEAEFEWNFGLLVVGIGTAWTSARADLGPGAGDVTLDGVGPVELAARHPIYQLVTDTFDTTLVAKFAVEVPTTSEVSKDFVFEPQLILPTKLGDRFFVQPAVSWEIEVGPEGRGYNALGYDLALGFHVWQSELPLPAVERLTPLLEFTGDLPLNQEDRYDGSISGSLGFRADLSPVAGIHPKLGFGYLFPVDKNARESFDWGVISSLVLEW